MVSGKDIILWITDMLSVNSIKSNTIKKVAEYNKSLWMALIEYEKVCDTIEAPALLEAYDGR